MPITASRNTRTVSVSYTAFLKTSEVRSMITEALIFSRIRFRNFIMRSKKIWLSKILKTQT